ncbi:aldo/keto reductase [Brevibacterium sp. 'Marine']|uniref:aldo/keto reductase n=1 Tax=Brevibacterium sp. 'Marine' TaxID=2725563 RepID=UPI00145F1977|nr:aldo/keto reductase [Brevibacterium sp. 'Marine']
MRAQSAHVLTRRYGEALGRGVNCIDTANLYSAGDAERVLGEIMGDKRDEVILTSDTNHR